MVRCSNFQLTYLAHAYTLLIPRAKTESLIRKSSSVHAGLRTRLSGPEDNDDDTEQGWTRIACDDIDDIGTKGVVEKILSVVGTETPVYLSIDIDVVCCYPIC